MSFEQASDDQTSSEQPSSSTVSSADSHQAGFEVELQQQLHLLHHRLLGEIHHEGEIIQGELRRNRLLISDELETTRDHLRLVVSDLASRLIRRLNLTLAASLVVIMLLVAKSWGM